jgi:hypothetical protein
MNSAKNEFVPMKKWHLFCPHQMQQNVPMAKKKKMSDILTGQFGYAIEDKTCLNIEFNAAL